MVWNIQYSPGSDDVFNVYWIFLYWFKYPNVFDVKASPLDEYLMYK